MHVSVQRSHFCFPLTQLHFLYTAHSMVDIAMKKKDVIPGIVVYHVNLLGICIFWITYYFLVDMFVL
jgi:hypothetical protein